tara:strand:+ start:2018 stop:2881 length:864 start_codon:yes stop_codon:yes gene_type:complete
MNHQPMILEGYDYSDDNNYSNNFSNILESNINNCMEIDNIINNLGGIISKDIHNNEEPFLKDLINKYDKNIDELFLKINIDNLNDIIDKYTKNDKKIEIDYNDSFSKLTDNLKKEIKINFNLSNDIKKLKSKLRETFDNMMKIEIELDTLNEKYNKNKNTIINVQETYKDYNDKKLLESFEKIFDEMNTNFIKENNMEDKLKQYIECGVQLNILLKIVRDVKSLLHFNNVCSICINNKLDKVLIPCGHTFCSECLKKNDLHIRINNRKPCCPICRKDIFNENNLYII